jgi:hypothetical protein
MEYHWNKTPEATNEVLKLFRNFIALEFDGSEVYPEGPTLKEWTVQSIFDFLQENGDNQINKQFIDIYRSNQDQIIMPMACSIGDYLRKYDNQWFRENSEANHKKMEEKYKK